ncbi:hypothetical protein N7454_007169 [Penicillium verhagenii]|nr:hypothetical protein N7454_007169 [Penicillium verhagenii]
MSTSPISCEDLAPPLPSNNDISGIGVVVNYVGTAGLATLLVIIYYFMVYEPANDPFRVNGQADELLSRPNPVDMIILRSLRGALKHIPLTERIWFGTNKKTELFFLKMIVMMGDLQVLSGLTILISGFAQLRSGLATYCWIVIVQLAWFSCLTHLCCLTLLRNHLYNNAIERGWRLVAMAALAVLDMVGLVFTGNYHWAFCSDCDYRDYSQLKKSGDAGSMTPAPNDYAICFMSVAPSSNGAFASMVVAMLLIILGFCTRVAKLYKPLSVGFFGRFRADLSRKCRRLLRRVYVYSGADRKSNLRWNLLYLPLLSIFFMGRFLLDQWSSLFLEVFWLLVSFTWGIAHVNHFMKQSEVIHFQFPDDNFDWSFGQVLSVLLLIAPVVSILESFSESKKTSQLQRNIGSNA